MAGPGSRIGCITRTRGRPPVITAGDLVERFGAQVAQMIGAGEHRSERIRRCVREERTPLGSPCRRHGRQWAAWAPKIQRGAPAGIAGSWIQSQLLCDRLQGIADDLHVLVEGYTELLRTGDQLFAMDPSSEGLVFHFFAHVLGSTALNDLSGLTSAHAMMNPHISSTA